jgi:glucose-6-phosphate isomerase
MIYMQEATLDDPGRCFAIEAQPGDKVVIPPQWAHAVINADPDEVMLFGACCVREYGFEYRAIRARGGLAWFPVWVEEEQQLKWQRNPSYHASSLVTRQPRQYSELNLRHDTPIYKQFSIDPESLQWISDPLKNAGIWEKFEP